MKSNKKISKMDNVISYQFAEVSISKKKESKIGDSTKQKKIHENSENSLDNLSSNQLPPPPKDLSKVEAIPIDSYVPILFIIAIVLIVFFAKKRSK